MKTVWPHEFFRLDFDQMLEEGRRQEEIHPANKGEYALVRNMHAYFAGDVLPLVIHDDWVFEAASTFASDFAIDCFRHLKLCGQEVYNTHKRLLGIKEGITELLARAHIAGGAPLPGTVGLAKASDFLSLVDLDKLPEGMRVEAIELHEQAKDHELLQLTVTLRAIRDSYEITLPRVMYVARRAMKVKLGLSRKASDNKLTGISEYIDWYAARIDSHHSLYPVLGRLREFYKVARNVASHHGGIKWEPASNEVTLPNRSTVLGVHVYQFQQRYRCLVYLCQLGVRGILSAFCQREQGATSDNLVREYINAFPEDFPASEEGVVRFYCT